MKTGIKICGLSRLEDIRAVNELKPDYCGFIIDYPKSRRNVNPEKVRELTASLDRSAVVPVGVFVNKDVEEVARALNDGIIDIAQLHGDEDAEYIRRLKSLSDKRVIKAFTMSAADPVDRLRETARAVISCKADHVLLDSGRGSGKVFDWKTVRNILIEEASANAGSSDPDKVNKDHNDLKETTELTDILGYWFLAGGLNSNNIEEAIAVFHPFAVDLSGAVETDGLKDKEKMRFFIEKIRRLG